MVNSAVPIRPHRHVDTAGGIFIRLGRYLGSYRTNAGKEGLISYGHMSGRRQSESTSGTREKGLSRPKFPGRDPRRTMIATLL